MGETGELSLSYLQIGAPIALMAGATSLALVDCVINAVFGNDFNIPSGAIVTIAGASGVSFTTETSDSTCVETPIRMEAGSSLVLQDITSTSIELLLDAFEFAKSGADVSFVNVLTPLILDDSLSVEITEVVVNGMVPGQLLVTRDDQLVSTVTQSAAGIVAITGVNLPFGSRTWDSGDKTNASGNTFTLLLLPAEPQGTFFYTWDNVPDGTLTTSAQRYVDLCTSRGLHIVTLGVNAASCAAYGCIGLGAYAVATRMFEWIHAQICWDNMVAHYFSGAQTWCELSQNPGNYDYSCEETALRPVCMLEH